jgi:hypothetical protein
MRAKQKKIVVERVVAIEDCANLMKGIIDDIRNGVAEDDYESEEELLDRLALYNKKVAQYANAIYHIVELKK